jgi:all-trans-8'-apo-beta-carotenal 15,15'-oxygenase
MEICINNAFDLKLKNLANTNVAYWAEKLMVFFEAGTPYRIDPTTLETIGEENMQIPELKSGMSVLVQPLRDFSKELHDSLFGTSMTAHPKVDAAKESFISWIWRAKVNLEKGPLDTNPMITIYEWNAIPSNPPISSKTHTFMHTTVSPHDFSFSENYYVFIENRVSGDTVPYILGAKTPASCVEIDPTKPMVLNLVHRSTGIDEFLCQDLVPGFTIHSICAFEKNNSLVLFTTAWKSETVASGSVKGGLLGSWEGTAPLFDDIPVTLLYKTVYDLGSRKLVSHAPGKSHQMLTRNPKL